MTVTLVEVARDASEHADLLAREQTVRNGDAEHGREALDVQTVTQAKRTEIVLRELACQEPRRLIAELRNPLIDELLVDLVVLIHGPATLAPAMNRPKYALGMS